MTLLDQRKRDGLRERMRAERGYSGRDFVILGLGRMMAQKRPRLYLEIADAIRRQVPSARFLWLGSGELDGDWHRWVRGFGLEDHVVHVPWSRETDGYLAMADGFLHTAEFEGMPLALLEAMGAGLPCFVTANLKDDMAFLDESNCMVADGGADWAALLADGTKLREIAEAGRSLVERKFSDDVMAAGYEKLYEEEVARWG